MFRGERDRRHDQRIHHMALPRQATSRPGTFGSEFNAFVFFVCDAMCNARTKGMTSRMAGATQQRNRRKSNSFIGFGCPVQKISIEISSFYWLPIEWLEIITQKIGHYCIANYQPINSLFILIQRNWPNAPCGHLTIDSLVVAKSNMKINFGFLNSPSYEHCI